MHVLQIVVRVVDGRLLQVITVDILPPPHLETQEGATVISCHFIDETPIVQKY